ncbi:DUF4307 domain-containing protein [Sphaerisporangium sp. TRM90804]|uniref:DUF4307 domain-containing protein n=1 Tax=Sphaerisporangium sp. TRM90804 TaxID=3031113 RepID=UPI0024469BF3|nr:DUF4307 domain-containing protein [Sphaerisporangium sp. TRM90804]MDH2428817.1 DUF4307 domain-containing protein [Sphaerisporangium sp. TRM90804]
MTDSDAGSHAGGPVLGTPDSYPERPGRFGRPGRYLAFIVLGVFVAAAMGGWGYVMMTAKGNPEALSQVIAFKLDGSSAVTVTFQVHKPAERTAVCRLRASDTKHVEVGARDVSIPPGREDVQLTERVETSARATSGHVQYCYLVE